jgi:hypothetical protein
VTTFYLARPRPPRSGFSCAGYHDHDLQGRWDALKSELEAELNAIADDVVTEYADALRPHQEECRRLAWEVNHLREEVQMVFAKMLADMNERAGDDILIPLVEFRSEREIVEHPDPLFDSTRGYLEQIARYKIFQGRDEAWAARKWAKRALHAKKKRAETKVADRDFCMLESRAGEGAAP